MLVIDDLTGGPRLEPEGIDGKRKQSRVDSPLEEVSDGGGFCRENQSLAREFRLGSSLLINHTFCGETYDRFVHRTLLLLAGAIFLFFRRRTVDKSSIKNRSAGKTPNTVQQLTTKNAAAAIGGSKARRVFPDGQGGFSIKTVLSLNAVDAGSCRPREGNKRPVTASAREINRLDKGGLNSGAVASLKGRDKTKRKAFVPKGERGGKKVKKISSNASAATAGGKGGNFGGGSCVAEGASSRSLNELMTGGLAARR